MREQLFLPALICDDSRASRPFLSSAKQQDGAAYHLPPQVRDRAATLPSRLARPPSGRERRVRRAHGARDDRDLRKNPRVEPHRVRTPRRRAARPRARSPRDARARVSRVRAHPRGRAPRSASSRGTPRVRRACSHRVFLGFHRVVRWMGSSPDRSRASPPPEPPNPALTRPSPSSSFLSGMRTRPGRTRSASSAPPVASCRFST